MGNQALKKVAIIGYGGMGSWHAKYILAGGAVELAGIYDINPARMDVAKENGINISCLSQYFHHKEKSTAHTIIINYSAVKDENIERAVELLFDSISM